MTHDPDSSRHARTPALLRALRAITALDVDAILECLHQDCTLQLPYEDAVPDLDKAGFGLLLTAMFTQYRTFTITVTHIYDIAGDDTLIARYTSDCISRAHESVTYANNYVGIFTFTDGLISSWREYDNPNISAKAQADDMAAAKAGR